MAKSAWAGALVFGVALVFLLWLAPAYSVPGRWAAIAAAFGGFEFFRPVSRPIWSALVAAASALPIANVGHLLNLLTALIGATTCWIVFALVRSIPFKRATRNLARIVEDDWARTIGGLVAAGFALAAPPLMIVSSRGDHAALDILLLLLPFLAGMRFAQKPAPGWFAASCLLLGLSAFENPTTLFVALPFVFWWLILLARHNLLTARTLLIGALASLFGLALLAVFLLLILSAENSAIRGLDSFWAVTREYLRIYKQEAAHGVPRLGWFLIFALNLLPFLIVLLRGLDEPNDTITRFGTYVFRVVLVGLAIFTLLNLPGAPQRVIGLQNLLVTPTIIVAIWFGFLIGYQCNVWLYAKRRVSVAILLLATASAIVFAAVRHARDVRAGTSPQIPAFADRVIENLNGRTLLVTEGSFDAPLHLAARKADRPLQILNLNASPPSIYARAHAARLGVEIDNFPAPLTPAAVLNHALAQEPDRADTIAVFTNPDLLRAPAHAAVPMEVLYLFFRLSELPDPQTVFTRHNQLPTPIATGAHEQRDSLVDAERFTRIWMSRLANDVGVYLDNANAPALANAAYQRALVYWPDNASAAINLLAHAGDNRDTAAATLKAIIDRRPEARLPAFRSQFFGRVRDFVARSVDAVQLLGADPLDQALASPTPPAREQPPQTHRSQTNEAPSPELIRERQAQIAAHLDGARKAAAAGDRLRSYAELNKAFELAPLRPDVLAAAGRIYLIQSDFALALRCWNILQLQFPGAAPVLTLRGATRFYQGEDAEALLEAAVSSAPWDAAGRFYLAALRLRQNRADEARSLISAMTLPDLTRALGSLIEERALLLEQLGADGYAELASLTIGPPDVDPDQLSAILTQTQAAATAFERREWTRAIEVLSALIKQGVRAPTLAYYLALARFRAEPTSSNLDLVEKVILEHPGVRLFARDYAYLCLEAEDYPRADRALKLIDATSSDEDILMRAAILAGTGHQNEAWSALDEIPPARRAPLVAWFSASLPAISKLREDSRFDSWQAQIPPPSERAADRKNPF